MSEAFNFWKPRQLDQGQACLCRFGQLRVWLRHDEKSWEVAWEYVTGVENELLSFTRVPLEVVPHGLDWKRYFCSGSADDFQLRPALPLKPVALVDAGQPYLPAYQTIQFEIGIPSTLQVVTVIADSAQSLVLLPSEKLPLTWMGSMEKGVLANWLEVQLTSFRPELEIAVHKLVCPLKLCNRTGEVWQIEKLELKPQCMTLFQSPHQLWVGEVLIEYNGKGRNLVYHYSKSAPNPAANLRTVTFGSL